MKIKRPKNWYSFRWGCELHDHKNSNMYSEENRHSCKRGLNKYGDNYSCKVQVCPVLKGKIPMNERQKESI